MDVRVFILLIVFGLPGAILRAQSPFLTNMPQNSNQRCVGVAGVAEALLEGKRMDKLSNIESLSQAIYESFVETDPITYPSRVMVKGKGVAIEDSAALTALSNRVAELYKADYRRLSNSDKGVQQLLKAQGQVVETVVELKELLADDPDKTVFFCCFGRRTFPDRTTKDTNHAVLIQSAKDGEPKVFDPNDPGAAIPCKLEATDEGLVVTWECEYRDQKVKTTQRYLVVPQQRYFKTMRVPSPGNRFSLIRQSGPIRQTAPPPCPCEK